MATPAPLTAAAIAQLVGGMVQGDGGVALLGVAPLDRARPDELSFLASSRYASLATGSCAGAVLVTPELADLVRDARCRIVVAEPYAAMLRALPALHPPAPAPTGIHPTAVIGRGATLGRDVSIGAYSVIGVGAVMGDRTRVGPHCQVGDGVRIGDDGELVAGVTLYAGTVLGHRVRVHAGARIGCDGFGYVPVAGEHQKIPHVGHCLVEDDVEIGANTCIDRGSIDDTVIGAGTKIDNLVHVAHNVRIGRLCLIMAQVGIAGSVHIGEGCILAGQVGISGHHTVGARATLAAQAGVFGDIPAGETWSGYPARPHKESLRAHAALFKLASLVRRIEKLLAREGA